MRRLLLTITMLVLAGHILAQEEATQVPQAREDSLSVPTFTLVPSGMGMETTAFPEFKLREPNVAQGFSYSTMGLSAGTSRLGTYELNKKFNFLQYAPKSYLLRWDEGKLTGFNNISMQPGIGSVATAGVIGVHHFSDELTLTGGAMLQKTGILYNTATLSALLSYQLTDYVSLNAFGAYETPSFMSMYHTPQQYLFGGYMTFHTEDKKWGVDLGGKTEPNPYTGRLETTPIVMPYYNLNGQKLGFDFGGLLKSIIINQRMKKEGYGPMGPFGPMGPMGPMGPQRPKH